MDHGRALRVPTGTALAPGRRPAGLAGLGGLPQGKVQRISLVLVLLDARTHHKVIDLATGDLAIGRVAANGKVDVAVIRGVGVPLLDQSLDHGDHGADLLGGAGTNIRIEHVGAAHDVDELIGELLCHLLGATALVVGAVDDLVVYIGKVLRKGYLEAARDKPAADHVEADERARIANVDVVIHRGAAHVHADLALLDGSELLLAMGLRIVDAHEQTSFVIFCPRFWTSFG